MNRKSKQILHFKLNKMSVHCPLKPKSLAIEFLFHRTSKNCCKSNEVKGKFMQVKQKLDEKRDWKRRVVTAGQGKKGNVT